MKQAAVLGTPIEHSLSPVLHNAGYEALGMQDWLYSRIECAADQLEHVVRSADASFQGFSVTMPCKFAALECADEVTPRAAAIGSANTLVRTEDGWRADNTDCEGIAAALQALVGDSQVEHAVLIGAGGTARPALWTLNELRVDRITVLNRSDRSAELRGLVEHSQLEFIDFGGNLEALTMGADVIISTVPSTALDGYISQLAHAPLLDVIYDPWPTPLAAQVAANGYRCVGGLTMLAGQSFSQFEQFTGQAAPREAMRDALEAYRQNETLAGNR